MQIAPGIFWVRVVDWQQRLFDSLIPLPYGISYNAYLVVGKDKVALVDTANPGFEADLLSKVSTHINPQKLDYVVMNHAEPDHAGSIQQVMEAAPDAGLVTTEKGAEMAQNLYLVPQER